MVPGDLVAHAVALRRGRQHEGEAHKEARALRQRPVSLGHVTRGTGEVGAAARRVAPPGPRS